ncbi:hypothetical protein AMATHDRAFT_6815 [Amanita thiersii Skay4041]|uniref:BTB domain-containing protein n=1 Tax=Amanita thiersii Skay4041 TaxID=703135 RepID=A0A2A9NDJ7_9AGAR|nr:hypothetical protein AMATHDRAFT_6815 [Amanita thiersii Skay4041]
MASRHPNLYFEDIILRVEDQLFKVPRHLFLEHSEIFRTTLDTPVEGEKPDGFSDDRPSHLYPSILQPPFTFTEWTSILKLAILYEMPQIQKLAMNSMLSHLQACPILQAKLEKEYDIKEWLVAALNRLVQQAKPLDEEDVEVLGISNSLKVMRLRETCRPTLKYDGYSRGYVVEWDVRERGEVNVDLTHKIRQLLKP